MKTPSTIPPDLAEVIGLHLGDGCLVRYEYGGKKISEMALTGNASEYPYYNTFVKPTLESSLGVTGRLYVRTSDNTTRYVVYSKPLVDYFASLGLPLGKKHDASIPRIIFDQGQVIPCIRGVYHAEGSIYRRYSKAYKGHARVYDALQTLQIRTKLKTLMGQVADELARLEIVCNRLTDADGVYTLRVTKQSEIAKFMSLIQPRLKTIPH